jgi:hypothetical protein
MYLHKILALVITDKGHDTQLEDTFPGSLHTSSLSAQDNDYIRRVFRVIMGTF